MVWLLITNYFHSLRNTSWVYWGILLLHHSLSISRDGWSWCHLRKLILRIDKTDQILLHQTKYSIINPWWYFLTFVLFLIDNLNSIYNEFRFYWVRNLMIDFRCVCIGTIRWVLHLASRLKNNINNRNKQI